MGINFGGVLYPWSSGQTIGCFVCSVVCWILFGLQQIYAVFTTKEDRIFPCEIGLKWEADVLFVLTATGLGASVVTIYFIPLYYQFVPGEPALDAGVRLLPMMFLMILASNIAGAALGRGLWLMPFALAGCFLVVIGGALMYALVQVGTRGSLIYGFSVIIGFGAGLYTQGPISVVQSLVSPNRFAEATAFVAFGQVVGITIMLAVANAVFLNRATIIVEKLLPNVPLTQIQAAIQGISTDVLSNLPGDLRRQIQEGIVASMNDVYVLVFVAGAMGVVLCPFVKRTKKD